MNEAGKSFDILRQQNKISKVLFSIISPECPAHAELAEFEGIL
jgi:hypothetical protein